nr:MAG TPA: hypothetical protein [Caudoviricetes sp.]
MGLFPIEPPYETFPGRRRGFWGELQSRAKPLRRRP